MLALDANNAGPMIKKWRVRLRKRDDVGVVMILNDSDERIIFFRVLSGGADKVHASNSYVVFAPAVHALLCCNIVSHQSVRPSCDIPATDRSVRGILVAKPPTGGGILRFVVSVSLY